VARQDGCVPGTAKENLSHHSLLMGKLRLPFSVEEQGLLNVAHKKKKKTKTNKQKNKTYPFL
jgi:hypothetical protein